MGMEYLLDAHEDARERERGPPVQVKGGRARGDADRIRLLSNAETAHVGRIPNFRGEAKGPFLTASRHPVQDEIQQQPLHASVGPASQGKSLE
jgi:hypothetical protein